MKAKSGTGGIKPCWLAESDNPARKGEVPYHEWLCKLGGLGSEERRSRDPRRSHRFRKAVIQTKIAKVKGWVMGGEKSEQGIVVNKVAGKAAMASDPVPRHWGKP
ncbi:hypothetical protein skT53_12860 [Effusibacillus dendaii]|uniref:Uncharacterized protein n=1 Tax=Effusibacillus dendaii TaxID=2743772 RepID=A0A7I8DEG4_9BACL|nr:hypothetical protein skT53_12860 [Effusibacillus dendaii]